MMFRFVVFVCVVLALIGVYPALLAIRSSHSEVKIDPVPKAIGLSTPLKIHVTNPHGYREAAIWLEQNGTREKLFEATRPGHRLAWSIHEPAQQDIAATVAAKKDGKAKLIAEVKSNDFMGSTDTAVYDIDVITRPPGVSTDGAQHYIHQGGSELVAFTPSGYWSAAGVHAGYATSRSFPKPGGGGMRFSLFAFPWDVPATTEPLVFVRNAAGTEVTAPFATKIFPSKFRKRDIELTDKLIDKVVGELDPSGTGDKLERFLKINREMRKENNKTLSDLRLKTAEKFLWTGPFLQLANSKVESHFADVRSYIYHGKKVDEQVHLGFDLSKVKHTPVLAANDGVVVYADRLGIYGNCIVVDHGYGLQSVYGHMSSMAVKPGDAVKKGQEMGKSGETGMAGGDHVHFTMQLDGTQINPVEWWDEHWIHDRILSKMQ
jgi:murein DD-endopeptidase MepM/ murein hydrolase activator NlpD